MMKFTYYIEYYIEENSDKKYYGYYSCNDKLEGSITITNKNVHSLYIDTRSVLASFLTGGKYLSNKALNDLIFLYDGKEYSIRINILKAYANKYEFNRYISNDLYLIIDKTFRGIRQIEENIEEEEVDEISNILKNKLEDLDLYSNYLLTEAEFDFLVQLDREASIQYCEKILYEICKLLDTQNISIYDKIDYNSLDNTHKKLYITLQTSLTGISHILYQMTSIFGFTYEYTPYISLQTYLSRLMEYIKNELAAVHPTPLNTEKDKKNYIKKELNKQAILEILCPLKYQNRMKDILNRIDTQYHITNCSKLDKACLILLLKEHCAFLDKNASKKFNKFRELILQYYEQSDVSYKENDCKNRKNELYSQYPIFWKEMNNK